MVKREGEVSNAAPDLPGIHSGKSQVETFAHFHSLAVAAQRSHLNIPAG
jgi:hypothetical protein